VLQNAFLVPVGIKYIEEIRRLDRSYRAPKQLPENWRDLLLIGGEESSGFTTRGHVTDKDGIWANLLILEMLAYYAHKSAGRTDSVAAIWKETYQAQGCWRSYGGKEDESGSGVDQGGSNSGRVDVDAILEAKEALIDYFLDYLEAGRDKTFAGMEIVFLGGIRYDIAELQLKDSSGNDQHYLRVRASGTEPINRIYVESSNREIAKTLIDEALRILEEASIAQVKEAQSEWRLVDIISQTQPGAALVAAVKQVMADKNWPVIEKLELSMPTLENRTQKIARKWIDHLK
jgi:phosphomannomutase